ncbi:MAG: glycosyltransferase family 39 protein [Candidatus Sericytochromatia bacterium]
MSNTQIIKSYIEKNFIFIIILFGLLIRLSALLPLKDIITNLADSFIYYDMAKNSYNGLGPKIDFIYSYMNMPKDITHIEDYYEPLFGLINSLFLYLGNGSFYSSLYISFFGGVISIPLTYIYSNILFNDKRISLLSAFFIASMPLMINRSIILMKESFVTCLYLILFIYFKKNIKSHNKYFYISLGIFSCLLGLVQYESIPILIISFSIFFLITRKIKEFFYFFLGYIPILAIYSFIFYNLTGLYTSTKYLFFFTSYQASDFSTHRALDINIFIKKFSKSFLYIYFTTLTNISLSIIFMFFLSIKYLSKSLITQFNAIFIIIHLLIHGIAVDLCRSRLHNIIPNNNVLYKLLYI